MIDIILTDAPVHVELPPLTKTEGETIAAMDGVLKRYRLIEWVRCRKCYAMNRMDGCRSVVSERLVEITCRCGSRIYLAPVGTDLRANRANSVLTGANSGDITVIDGSGNAVTLKSVRMEPEDAAICHFYSRVMGELQLNPKFAHIECWDRRPFDASAMEVLETPTKLALKCNCSVYHFDGAVPVH